MTGFPAIHPRLLPPLGLLSALVLGLSVAAAPAERVQPVIEKGDKVLVIPLEGAIEQAHIFFLRRSLLRAREAEFRAVVIDMETPGGRLDITEEIVAWIRTLNKPVYVFVRGHAQSAGAIISFGCDKIFMAPHSRIGSATPVLVAFGLMPQNIQGDVREKLLSDLRALMRDLARENGHDPNLAEAMVDPAVEVKIGDRVVSAKGALVNLTAEEAVEVIPPRTEPLLATAVVDDIDGLLAHEGLDKLESVRMHPTGSEHLGRILLQFHLLLLAVAVICIIAECLTPGFGVFGISGVVCLGLWWFGYLVAGMASYFEALLILIGIVLLAMEIFVIPGFGVCGITGIISLLAGIVLTMVPALSIARELGDRFDAMLYRAIGDLGLAFVLVVIGGYLVARFLPRTSAYSALVLQGSTSVEEGYIATSVVENTKLLGMVGTAVTALRPAGIALLDEKRVDVVSSGDFIDKGETVRVKEVEGARVVVVRLPPGADA